MSIVKLIATNGKLKTEGVATHIHTHLPNKLFVTSADLVTYKKKKIFGGYKEVIFDQIVLINKQGKKVKAKCVDYLNTIQLTSISDEHVVLTGSNYAILEVVEECENFTDHVNIAHVQQHEEAMIKTAGLKGTYGKVVTNGDNITLYNAYKDACERCAGAGLWNNKQELIGIVHSYIDSFVHVVEDEVTDMKFIAYSSKESKRKVSAIATPLDHVLHRIYELYP